MWESFVLNNESFEFKCSINLCSKSSTIALLFSMHSETIFLFSVAIVGRNLKGGGLVVKKRGGADVVSGMRAVPSPDEVVVADPVLGGVHCPPPPVFF